MFRYKQFVIEDSNSAMKVGTDGTMLGCWVDTSEAENILDIGCGSGVLGIICAQKNNIAKITGIDVEEGAIRDAKRNVERLDDSWSERISIVHSKLQDFVPSEKLDLILSNPPFFENSQISPDDARNYARHTNSLHYQDILEFSKKHLTEGGKVNLVLPYQNGINAIKMGNEMGFYLSRACTVYPVPQKSPHRILIELSNVKSALEETSLTIETGLKRHDYTPEYQKLGKDFYLYF